MCELFVAKLNVYVHMIMNERNMNILFNSSIQKYVLSKFDERGADVFSSSLL